MPDHDDVFQPETLGAAVQRLSAAVQNLQAQQGINRRAVVALLVDSTKLPKRTITLVLEGLEKLGATYCNDNEHNPA